jgi:hypothetical protein
MRQQFIEQGYAPDERYARKLCPWAARVIKVEGGYLCFESETDYLIWRHQQ